MPSLHLIRRFTALALLPLLSALVACQSAETGHDHEDFVLEETAWSKTHEVLVVHRPLLVDTPTTFTVFVTHLQTGLPVQTGALRLNWLSPTGATATHEATEPLRPGVYEFTLALPAADVWNLTIDVPGATIPVVLPVLRVYRDPEVAAHADREVPADTIVLGKQQQWRLGVRTATVARDTFVERSRVAATVEAPPARRMVVTTPVAGRVAPTPSRALPTLGEHVTAGEELAVIRAPLTGDAADLAAAEAAVERTRQDLHLAEAELERAQELVAADAAPARRTDEAASQVAAARAAHAAARRLVAGGDGPELLLKAPIDGLVVAVAAGSGEYVDAGSAVFTLLDPSVVWIRGWIPESSLPDLPRRPEATLECAGYHGAACFATAPELIYLAPEIDPASRTAAVVYAVPNADGHLRVGQSLGLRLETVRRDSALVVPRTALVDEHGRPVIYVQTGGDTFVKRHVTLGGDDGVRVVLESGVLAGERVVVDSAWAVKLAAAGSATPAHGHAH